MRFRRLIRHRNIVAMAVLSVLLTTYAMPAAATLRGQASPSTGLERIAAALERRDARLEDEGCPDGRNDPSSNLCAQWKAADAASWTMWASWLGMLISIGTLFFAWRAARWAKGVAIDAKHYVRAAKEALIHSREIAETEFRPLLLFERQEMFERSVSDIIQVILPIKFTNHGSIPARISSTFINRRELGEASATPDPIDDVEDMRTTGRVIPVKGEFTIELVFFEIAAPGVVIQQASPTRASVRVTVDYENALKKRDITYRSQFGISLHLVERYEKVAPDLPTGQPAPMERRLDIFELRDPPYEPVEKIT